MDRVVTARRLFLMFLLDTNVTSEIRKASLGRAYREVENWFRAATLSSLQLPVIAIHELDLGVRLMEKRDPSQGAMLRHWSEQSVLLSFAERILPIDVAVARQAAALHRPNTQPFRDCFIAANAVVHGMCLVTRNVADFVASGVEIINPWQPV